MTDPQHFESQLDRLSLDLVLLDPDNLIALGEFLEKVEPLIVSFREADFADGAEVLDVVRRSVEAVILEQTPDPRSILEQIGKNISRIQEALRSFVPSAEPGPSAEKKPDALVSADEANEDQELFFGFINEARDHLENIEVHLIDLEHNREDEDAIQAVFRLFHTIKGVSGFLNLKHVHGLTHNVENLLDSARKKTIAVGPRVIDIIFDAVDRLKQMIEDLREQMSSGLSAETDYGLEELFARITEAQQTAGQDEEPARAGSGRKLGEILVEKGVLGSPDLERVLDRQEKDRARPLGKCLVERGAVEPEDVEKALVRQEQTGQRLGAILVETGKVEPDDLVRAVHEQERLREQKLGEILVREKQAEAREVAGALRQQQQTQGPVGHTVKVDTDKLDTMVDLVGELVIAQSLVMSNDGLKAAKDQKLLRDLNQLARITSDLQRMAMTMRMVQIRQTFQKMLRLVRDLSRKSGKMVELVMTGEDTEIDRNMVEAIYDPLVHMIRNSVDHGIERPEVRRRNGKPVDGRIELAAYHQSGHVVIEISDDGQGLNRDKIRAKAVERGLIEANEYLSDQAVFGLIFQPGFSTAEQVTDVSGRGVGMDVVKRAIDQMRGKIDIQNQPGAGSTFRIRLPLTLAIIDGMIVRVGEHRYILPTLSIHESFRPNPADIHLVRGEGEMVKVRKRLLPVIRLDRVLGVKASAASPAEALMVVVEYNDDRRCLMVDEVLGKQEVVIKSLGESLNGIPSLAGGSILGDGRVGLILDVGGVFEVSDRAAQKPSSDLEGTAATG